MSYGAVANRRMWYSKWQNTTTDLIEATGDHDIFDVPYRMDIVEFGIVATEAFATDVTDGVVSLDHQPTYDSATGRTTLANLTIPDATILGGVVRTNRMEIGATVNLTIFTAEAGSQLVTNVSTAGVDAGTEAGEFYTYIIYELHPENNINETNVIEVAL